MPLIILGGEHFIEHALTVALAISLHPRSPRRRVKLRKIHKRAKPGVVVIDVPIEQPEAAQGRDKGMDPERIHAKINVNTLDAALEILEVDLIRVPITF